VLGIAAQAYDLTGLGYVGVEIVLHRDKGPLLLGLNARPGLNIQIANRAGLLPRLQLIERIAARSYTVEERVAFAKDRIAAP